MKISAHTSVIYLLSSLITTPAIAAKPDKVLAEVSYLLSEIKHSPCKLKRNGTLHNGVAAEKHIRRKYNYARSRIKSAEQFIAYTATKSSMSGIAYMLICNNNTPQTTASWLMNKLAIYRATKSNQ